MADFSMRARNAADTAYVYWISVGAADPLGNDAPEAIFAGSAVVLGNWGGPGLLLETVVNELTLIESFAVPATATDPGTGGYSLVLVDTANASWSADDVIALPFPLPLRGRVIVKDATGAADTKPIRVFGNGNNIDGGALVTIAMRHQAFAFLAGASDWVVV